ncbi:MAG: MFS transporter [Treponema sp.]|jgi:MFS family permease|nr:MFS transporter [Treponema sp.]
MSETKGSFKGYLGITMLIGFGFLTMGLMDPLYDTYIPIFLRRYISSNAAIGGVMTLDNILQLFLIPVIAVWSDRTRTRLGRRMPFIIVMLPIAGILFAFIPLSAATSFWALIILLFVFNIFKTSVRGPVVALMPDIIPGVFRSEANGVINMMGAFGLIGGTLVLAPMMNKDEKLPFLISAFCIFAAVAVLLLFVREKNPETETEESVPILASIKQAFSGHNASVPRILISLFFWFMAYEGLKPFLGLYMVDALKVSEGYAALAQGVAGIAGAALAIPTGYLAHKLGRRNYIRRSLFILTIVLCLIPLCGPAANLLGLTGTSAVLIFFLALMFIYGAVWIGVVVNSFPMLWQMATFGTMGIYTGLYYTFSQSAAILAPPITGLVIDLAGYSGIFIFGAVCMLIAFFVMGGVTAGEPESKGV